MKAFDQNLLKCIEETSDNHIRNRIIGDTISTWLRDLNISHDHKKIKREMDISDLEKRPDFITDYGSDIYLAAAQCSYCGSRLTADGIRESFTDDPFDTRIVCPYCNLTFQPHMTIGDDDCYFFLCPDQTLISLATIAAVHTHFSNASINLKQYPHISHNMIIHFSGYTEEVHQDLLNILVHVTDHANEGVTKFANTYKKMVLRREAHYSREVIEL